MDFDWHPPKDVEAYEKRSFRFADAVGIFLGRVVEWPDIRKSYGEVRMIAVGDWDGDFYTVIYTDRTDEAGAPVRWIITAWQSHRKERALWRRSA